MNDTDNKEAGSRTTMPQAFLLLVSTLLFTANAQSALITYQFAGNFTSTSTFFNSGDAFSGSYTFESAASGTSPHSDSTLDTQTPVIGSTLPGTGWTMDVVSSATANFSVSGTSGRIASGNNTTFGDRYVVSLSPIVLLPDGTRSFGLQMDLQDPTSAGADMLSGGAFHSLPNLALASYGGGRFLLESGFGCTQCFIRLTSLSSLSAVPVPAAIWLFGTGLIGLIRFNRRRMPGD